MANSVDGDQTAAINTVQVWILLKSVLFMKVPAIASLKLPRFCCHVHTLQFSVSRLPFAKNSNDHVTFK